MANLLSPACPRKMGYNMSTYQAKNCPVRTLRAAGSSPERSEKLPWMTGVHIADQAKSRAMGLPGKVYRFR